MAMRLTCSSSGVSSAKATVGGSTVRCHRVPAPRCRWSVGTSNGALAARQVAQRRHSEGSRLVAHTSGGSTESDFDAVLARLADKFEKSDNKPVIIAYVAGSVFALFFAEYIIHQPLLNVLLGFPIQLLGLLLLPYFGVRYLVEEKDLYKDVGEVSGKVIDVLPGLKK